MRRNAGAVCKSLVKDTAGGTPASRCVAACPLGAPCPPHTPCRAWMRKSPRFRRLFSHELERGAALAGGADGENRNTRQTARGVERKRPADPTASCDVLHQALTAARITKVAGVSWWPRDFGKVAAKIIWPRDFGKVAARIFWPRDFGKVAAVISRRPARAGVARPASRRWPRLCQNLAARKFWPRLCQNLAARSFWPRLCHSRGHQWWPRLLGDYCGCHA